MTYFVVYNRSRSGTEFVDIWYSIPHRSNPNMDLISRFEQIVYFLICECEWHLKKDEEIEDVLSNDFEVGHFLRDRVIPNAVLFFTGEALDDEDEVSFVKR